MPRRNSTLEPQSSAHNAVSSIALSSTCRAIRSSLVYSGMKAETSYSGGAGHTPAVIQGSQIDWISRRSFPMGTFQ